MRALAEPELDAFQTRVRRFLVNSLGDDDGEVVFNAGRHIDHPQQKALYYACVVKDVASIINKAPRESLRGLVEYKWQPVGVEEFICGEDYLDKSGDIYPKVLEELVEINSGKYVEVVLTGGIGSAKTTAALYTNAYQLYLLSCLENPHALYGLDRASEIVFIFQSLNQKLAKGVDFQRFKSMVEGSNYFQQKFPFRKDLESRLVFPNRIEVAPVSGQETAAIGQNVIGGILDELNYMSIVEKSKQSVDKGTFDQAIALYNSIARRRKSRFMKQGKMPGILCLVSSKRYPGQFTDIKEAEAKTDKTIYIYDYRVWDVKPPGSFSGKMFRVYKGDIAHKPRIIGENERLSEAEAAQIIEIPVEFRTEFEGDIINSLREIAGVSTLARHPFLIQVEQVAAGFGKHASIFSREWADFVDTKLEVFPRNFYKPELPRFVHIDLAVTGDSAGVCIGTCPGFTSLKAQGFGDSDTEMMPLIHIDGILEVKPPRQGEILFWKIRALLMKLRELGLNIRWVTFDSYESRDSQQLLRQQGFISGCQSVDVNSTPYDYTKGAFYTGRLRIPTHQRTLVELVSLEKDNKTGKIDHPPGGSKDCSDALAGVVFGLTSRREIWSLHRIPTLIIPSSVGSVLKDEGK